MVEKLHNGVSVNWFTLHQGVHSHDFTVEAKCWLSIICAKVIPSTHDTEVTLGRALVTIALLDGLQVNIR